MSHAKVAEIGFALQSGVGVPADDPAYALGVLMGLPTPRQDHAAVNPAAHRLVTQEVQKGNSRWEVASTIWAHPASLGVLLKAILPTENVSGGGPYDHAFTPAAADTYLTLFSRQEDLTQQFPDGLVESFILEFDSGRRVAATLQATGLTPAILADEYTPGSREDDDGAASVFHYIGGSLKMEWDTTPAANERLIEGGALRLTRRLTVVQSADSFEPMALMRGPLEVELEGRLILEDWAGYRATFMGSTVGSDPSATVVYGAADFTFQSASVPTHTLRLQLPRLSLAWEAPQPALRGALMVDVNGVGVRPASGSIVTATLRNALSASY